MAKKTLAQLDENVGYLNRGGIGYRRVRATAVLAMSSRLIKSKQDVDLNKALASLRKLNFDMDRLSDTHVEVLYAAFDGKMSDEVCAEFTFHPSIGNIRDLCAQTGHCDLCGKGDSRDDGANEDKLRYQFKLTNTAGGDDVWVGSSCILQHGLHVDGAANAEQAKEILKRTMAEHMALWKMQNWQIDHPDHESIPAFWATYSKMYFRSYPDAFWLVFGLDVWMLVKEHKRHFKKLRTASKFYARRQFLTETKTADWMEAKKFARTYEPYLPMFREVLQAVGGYWTYGNLERLVEALEAKKAVLDAQAALKKKKRTPRREVA